jgi:hypothetical protein
MTHPRLLLKPIALALTLALLACGPARTVRVREAAPEVQATPLEVSKSVDAPSGITNFVLPAGTESPQVFAVDLLSPSLLAGPQFQVAPEVELKGHQGSFKIKSDYGRLDADSVEILQQRVQEITALAELERLSGLKVFGKSAANSIKRTGSALYNVFRNPEATAKAIPQGIKSKVSNTWASIKLKTKELGDDARGKIRGDGAPPEFNAFLADPPVVPEKTWEERAKSQGSKFGLDYIGYNRSRRELTKELGIDPYTSNPQIEDRLDAFAWSYLAGGATTGLTLGAITGGTAAGFVLAKTNTINKLVYDLPPEDLKKRNLEEMKKIGLTSDTARNFVRNSTFTPTMQTTIVDLIAQNWQADGWGDLLRYLRYVDSEVEARFIVNSLRMGLAQPEGNKVKQVMMVGVNPVFVRMDQSVVIPAPVDYVHYNAKLKAFLGEPQLRGKSAVEVQISGKLSPLAEQAFAARGFAVKTGATFQGSPAYAQPENLPEDMKADEPKPEEITPMDPTQPQ